MFAKEDLDSWNELFPDCKMRDADLSNPTEAFLVKTLINYLRMFGYRVESPSTLNVNDGSREKRVFLIRLAWNTERILKLTDKSYTFTYYDLLRPTPKKTSHMLGILLNYLYYYNMYRTDVFSMANDRLKSRQEFLDNIKHTEEENEQLKTKSEKMKEDLTSLSKQLPQTKAEYERLYSTKTKLNDHLRKLQESVKGLHIKIDELSCLKRKLERQIVPHNEGEELKQEIKALQKDMKEREEMKNTVENNLKKQQHDLVVLQGLLKNIELANDIITSNVLESYKLAMKKLSDMNEQLENLKTKKEDLLENIKWLEQSLQLAKENQKSIHKQFEDEKQKKLQFANSKEKNCGELEELINTLKLEEHSLECELDRQRDIFEYVQKHANILMKPYKQNRENEVH